MWSSSPPQETPNWWLAVDSGPDAGQLVAIPPGGVTVGRRPTKPTTQGREVAIHDPTVSAEHLRVGAQWIDSGQGIVPVIEPLAGHNPVLLDGEPLQASLLPPIDDHITLRLGATTITIGPTPPPDQHAALGAALADGRHGFHRPPRPARPDTAPSIYVPPARADARPPSRLSMSAIVAPLALGAVLAVAMNPRFALLALTSPLMVIANWLEDRRRVKRERANGQRSTSEELARFTTSLIDSQAIIFDSIITAHPGLGQLALRAEIPTVSLWERRVTHQDHGMLVIGHGSRHLAHQLVDPRSDWLTGCRDILSEHTTVHDLPITVSLVAGSVLGVHGDSASRHAVARSLVCQAALLHGPADLAVVVLTDPQRLHHWGWAARLPHAGSPSAPTVSISDEGAEDLISTLTEEHSDTWTIIVVDTPDALERPQIRALLSSPPAGSAILVLGERADRLPSQATTVIGVDSLMGTLAVSAPLNSPEARARLATQRADVIAACVSRSTATEHPIVLTGCSVDSATRITARLARLADAEERRADASLPDAVTLGSLIDSQNNGVDAILGRWSRSDRTKPVAPIAVSELGTLSLDLATDGPHGLIAGTTGSGKSELLRSLVTSLAVHHPPTHITFVLIDYKGGAAFSTLARLPHVVGMVTDLDAGLGQRALRCLEAELRYREHLLNDHGADDLNNYCGTQPLPRLVVVIDEFATMAADLPDFITSLVGIAQRGRSLGVHLLLATQRPAGAVNDSIRANMNLRISLRVQSTADSADVLGVGDACQLSRRFPGRALVRTGPSELLAVQTASSTLPPLRPQNRQTVPRFIEEARPPHAADESSREATEPTDLERMVEWCIQASAARGDMTPRRPWPEPLPTSLTVADLHHMDPDTVAATLYDLPDSQRQTAVCLDLAPDNVSFIGAARSRTDLAAAVTIATLCLTTSPAERHFYIVDFGSQALSALSKLPHVGAVITPGEPSRLHRLARHLTAVLEQRRSAAQSTNHAPSVASPQITLAIDNWSAVKAAHDDLLGNTLLDSFARLFADGPKFGITTLITSDRPNSLSSAMSSSFAQRFVFQLLDPLDDSMLGIKRDASPRTTPGRAIDMSTYSDVQFAIDEPLADLIQRGIDRWTNVPSTSLHRPPEIGVLPAAVAYHPSWSAGHTANQDRDVLQVSFALGDHQLEPVGWSLAEGEHGVVAGPPSTGKTTALATIAAAARAQFPAINMHALCGRRKQLVELTDAEFHATPCALIDRLNAAEEDSETEHEDRPRQGAGQLHLILIDDAEFIDDEGSQLLALIHERREGLWICASARPDALRSSYGTFTAALRKSRQGFILRPQREVDGELWMTTLPRKNTDPLFPAGRGFLIRDGFAELAQVMVTLDQRWLGVPMSTTIES